jgi:serine/threonine protein kinase
MKLKHPNIADVIDFYEDENQIAFIMEFVESVELKDKILPGGLSVAESIAYLKPLAAAVDYLHSQKIVHRDLKPANVKIKPDGTPVILDFGIAKDSSEKDSKMTQTGMTMGTRLARYFSKNQSFLSALVLDLICNHWS